jgi:imidazole glycerol-phosphate synthase subunit HisH
VNPKVVVLDHGSGNLRSAQRALTRAGASVTVTADPQMVMECDGLVVPGVGAFAACMSGINSVGGPRLIDRRISGGQAVLGICVGMQIMFDSGDERGEVTPGLGQWPGVVRQLQAPILPHMGWNTVRSAPGSRLFNGVEGERFYFVHSYAATTWELPSDERRAAPQVTWAEHGETFVAAVENGPLSAVQFHPEKSGDAGAAILRNWINTLRD